ncbi:POU domain, class 3, transcription factor 3-like [Ischnura elegans]|uniref:POU domain, class 3, transcription factor 3-like n=1 Tax=Ischnura elegans TaxID=197161 RepID=UPI001ED88A69|nr:POU domain, class 3, transcription factor 3-like [Ischnura elegans]
MQQPHYLHPMTHRSASPGHSDRSNGGAKYPHPPPPPQRSSALSSLSSAASGGGRRGGGGEGGAGAPQQEGGISVVGIGAGECFSSASPSDVAAPISTSLARRTGEDGLAGVHASASSASSSRAGNQRSSSSSSDLKRGHYYHHHHHHHHHGHHHGGGVAARVHSAGGEDPSGMSLNGVGAGGGVVATPGQPGGGGTPLQGGVEPGQTPSYKSYHHGHHHGGHHGHHHHGHHNGNGYHGNGGPGMVNGGGAVGSGQGSQRGSSSYAAYLDYNGYSETKYAYSVSGMPGTPAQASAAAAFFAR